MRCWLFIVLILSVPLHAEFKLGLENISREFIQQLSPDHPLTIALITNQTGKDQHNRRNVHVLQAKGIIVKYLFAPEHGLTGTLPASAHVANGYDKETNIPIISLYKNEAATKQRDQCLKEVDALFFDIQDSGMRHYTYISTLFYAIEYAAYHNKPIVILDRPNPLGTVMEGPVVEAPLKSFISIAEIPLRHGLTVGELAYFFNTHTVKKRAQLYIIPMKDYDRTHGIGTTLLAALSPNITCVDACYGYSFLGLLGEIKPFDVGIGTPLAFQIIALPITSSLSLQGWETLKAELLKHGINASYYSFYHKKKKKKYHGLKLHMPDINTVCAFNALLSVLEHAKKAKVPLHFSTSFDKAAGTTKIREFCIGTITREELMQAINPQLQQFFEQAQPFLHYSPSPKPSRLSVGDNSDKNHAGASA